MNLKYIFLAAAVGLSPIAYQNTAFTQEARLEQVVKEEQLSTKIGPLIETVPLFKLETIQHADQLMKARIKNPDLRNDWYYTADFPLYTNEADGAYLYLARGKNNLIFKNLEEATIQLSGTDNYIPPKEDIESVINAESTLRIKLSDLGLIEFANGISQFKIDTSEYKLNSEQKKLAERIYGQGEDFKESMAMLYREGIAIADIYVLNPEYVKENVVQGSAIARASWLFGFADDSGFDADVVYVGNRDGLRGVLKENTEGAQKISPIIQQNQ